jgi:DNA primase
MNRRIKDTDVGEVRVRNRIEEVVGEYVALRRAGADSLKGLCPFHEEKTPSFHVRPAHGTFHCFGCREGGSVVDFVMKIEHLGFVEALQRLAHRVGFALTYTGGGSSVQRERGTRSRLVEVNRLAQEFYAQQLSSAEAEVAREFLAQRTFSLQEAARFGCGFAPSGWDQLTKYLLGQGFSVEELIKAGVSREGQRGPIDRFHRRLLWPIRDLSGDVVGFGARRLFDDDRIEAKYLNTPETVLYRKSQVLFGLDVAKRAIARRRQVVVVEGYTDVMAMHQAGVPTAVASCGTAFGAAHISVLRRLLLDDFEFHGEVIFIFDGDTAGQKAALKAFSEDQSFAAQTFIALAPGGMDPCELRQTKGDAALRELVAARVPLFTFAVKTLLAAYDLDTAEGRVEALRRTVPLIAAIKNFSLRDEYARQLAGWTGWHDTATVVRRVREAAGERSQRRGRHSDGSAGESTAGASSSRPDVTLRLQREALKAVLQAPAMAGPAWDELPREAFTDEAYAQVHAAVLAAGGATAGIAGSVWVETVTAACPHRSLVTELAVEPLPVEPIDTERYIASVLARLRAVVVGQQVAEIRSRLQRLSPLGDTDSFHQLFGDLLALEHYHRTLRQGAARTA